MISHLLLHEAGGWHWWFFPFWILLWLGVIVVLFRVWPWRRRCDRRPDARAILAERFARGEIDAAEYAARRDVLSQ
jgi:putative membrane protein